MAQIEIRIDRDFPNLLKLTEEALTKVFSPDIKVLVEYSESSDECFYPDEDMDNKTITKILKKISKIRTKVWHDNRLALISEYRKNFLDSAKI